MREAGPRRGGRSPPALAALGLLALLAFAGLVALGTWQIERRAWKADLIARVEARVRAEPVEAPSREPRTGIAADDAYRRVRATGTFLHDSETLVQAVTELGGGFWVMTPLARPDGTLLLVNRGFVPAASRTALERKPGQVAGPVSVTGLLRLTEPGGGFLRTNDPAGDRWFSRDVAAIAAARGLTGTAPYFIDADAAPNPGGLPVGGLTVVAFSDNHLVYALTWFTLALMVAAAGFYLGRHEWRLRRA